MISNSFDLVDPIIFMTRVFVPILLSDPLLETQTYIRDMVLPKSCYSILWFQLSLFVVSKPTI